MYLKKNGFSDSVCPYHSVRRVVGFEQGQYIPAC